MCEISKTSTSVTIAGTRMFFNHYESDSMCVGRVVDPLLQFRMDKLGSVDPVLDRRGVT